MKTIKKTVPGLLPETSGLQPSHIRGGVSVCIEWIHMVGDVALDAL